MIVIVWSSSAQVRGWFPSLQHWHVVCMETAPRQLGVNLGGRVIKSLCDPSARNKQFWHANFYRIERGNNIGNFVPRPSFNVGVRKKWKIINVQSILILRLCLVIFEFVMGTWEVVTEISNKNTLLNTDTMLCLHKFRRDQHKQFIQPSTTTTSVATQVDISGSGLWWLFIFVDHLVMSCLINFPFVPDFYLNKSITHKKEKKCAVFSVSWQTNAHCVFVRLTIHGFDHQLWLWVISEHTNGKGVNETMRRRLLFSIFS